MARSGLTTGTCAAAATSAAAQLLLGNSAPPFVEVALPRSASKVVLPVHQTRRTATQACASILKPPNDDPDVTQGLAIEVCLESIPTAPSHQFVAGPGVGTITRPGLSYPVGEPAINPVPRQMIAQILDEQGLGPCRITLAVENGAQVAQQTFNPRLGIEGGISILGTTGIVRPYCRKAMCDAIRVNLKVVRAQTTTAVLVPGNIGYRSAHTHWNYPTDHLVEVGNEWAAGLLAAKQQAFSQVVLVGHPGKLAKLAVGAYYTHSHHSPSALPVLHQLAQSLGIPHSTDSTTTEGFLSELSPEFKQQLINRLCIDIEQGVYHLWQTRPPFTTPQVVIHLVSMDGTPL